jgi:DNA-binding response OmpR family regulator
MTDTPRLIVADRDDRLRDHLVGQLLADGLEAEPACTPAEVRCRADRGPDLLLLGEFEEATAALELLREIRTGDALTSRLDPSLPVVVLSGAGGEWVPLRAFEAGCDDFLRKPASYLELRARVRAILRRTMRGAGTAPRRVGALTVDPRRLEARYAGIRLDLARLELALLCRLADDPLRVFTKRELLRDVWGYRADARTRTLDAHACRLRRKLQRAGATGHVVNTRGVGYRLIDRVPEMPGSGAVSETPVGGETGRVVLQRLGTAA